MGGKLPGFVLAVKELAVSLDVKNAASALDELSGDTGGVVNRGCQTGSVGFVVSLDAIGNGNAHKLRFGSDRFVRVSIPG